MLLNTVCEIGDDIVGFVERLAFYNETGYLSFSADSYELLGGLLIKRIAQGKIDAVLLHESEYLYAVRACGLVVKLVIVERCHENSVDREKWRPQ